MSDVARKALVVLNLDSHAAKDAKACLEELQDNGMLLLRRPTSRARLNDLILSMRDEIDCVIMAGDDSVLSAGAIALRDSGLPLGIIPMGEQAELAHRLGITPENAAAAILNGRTRTLDLGTVNGRPYFNVATIGLSVLDARVLERAANGRMGRTSYIWTAARMAFARRRFSCIIRCGAIVHRVRTIQVTIGNGRFYKGGMPPGGSDASEDSFLGVYSLEPKTKWGLVLLDRAFAPEGDAPPAEVRTARSPVVEVVTRLPQPVSADGEIVTVTPARFGILQNAVNVFIPPEPARPAPACVEPALPA